MNGFVWWKNQEINLDKEVLEKKKKKGLTSKELAEIIGITGKNLIISKNR